MIWPACGGSQAVESTSYERMFFRESTNAEQETTAAGGESSRHSSAFVNGMNCPYPDENDEFILRIDDLIVEPADANGSGFLVDAGRSLVPRKQPCTTASTETPSHPITRIGSDLEALIAAYMEEGNDFTSSFDAGKAPTSHGMLSNATQSRMCSYPVASFGANSAPQNTVAAHTRVTNFAFASIGANNTPQNMGAAHSGMASFRAASIGAYNAPWNRVAAHSGMINCAVASIGATNAPQNTGAAHRRMTSFGVASIGAYSAPQPTLPHHKGMASFGVANIGAYNAPLTAVAAHSRMSSFVVGRIGANNAPQNPVADHAQLPPVAPSSNSGGGGWPNLNTTIDDEGIFDLDDLF